MLTKLFFRPQVAELDLSFGIVTPKRTYYCYCESRAECMEWMRALRSACRLGDIALPVGHPLIEGLDEGEFKERFKVQSPSRVSDSSGSRRGSAATGPE